MSDWEDELRDRFLAELDPADAEVLARLGRGKAPSDLRARILADASLEGRFDRFAAQAAELLAIDETRARELLDGIGRPESWEPSPLPEIDLFHVDGGPGTENAITGFVRIPAGLEFPHHEHLGDEAVLIIQGSCEDTVSGRTLRPGDVARMPPETAHGLRVRPGPDLVYLSVVQSGLTIGDAVFRPEDL